MFKVNYKLFILFQLFIVTLREFPKLLFLQNIEHQTKINLRDIIIPYLYHLIY